MILIWFFVHVCQIGVGIQYFTKEEGTTVVIDGVNNNFGYLFRMRARLMHNFLVRIKENVQWFRQVGSDCFVCEDGALEVAQTARFAIIAFTAQVNKERSTNIFKRAVNRGMDFLHLNEALCCRLSSHTKNSNLVCFLTFRKIAKSLNRKLEDCDEFDWWFKHNYLSQRDLLKPVFVVDSFLKASFFSGAFAIVVFSSMKAVSRALRNDEWAGKKWVLLWARSVKTLQQCTNPRIQQWKSPLHGRTAIVKFRIYKCLRYP